MNRLLLSLILFLAINIVSSGQSQTIKSGDKTEDSLVWKSLSEDKYEISYPSDWDVDTSGRMGTNFFLFSPLSSQTDQFKENVNLIIQDLTGYNLTLDQYVEISEKQLETMIPDGKIYSNERIKNDQSEYQKIIYSGKQGAFDLKFEQFYWVIRDNAFVLTLTCEKDQFDGYQEIGEKILNSFEIK